ncbi:UNVERIFIED_CONTAM: hypothetical protein RMT77_018600 [Armadillidium vulgare]
MIKIAVLLYVATFVFSLQEPERRFINSRFPFLQFNQRTSAEESLGSSSFIVPRDDVKDLRNVNEEIPSGSNILRRVRQVRLSNNSPENTREDLDNSSVRRGVLVYESREDRNDFSDFRDVFD